MRQNIDRVRVIRQRIEAVARGVLDLELVPDTSGQKVVGTSFISQTFKLAKKFSMALLKCGQADRILGVQHAAVSQHDAQPDERLVAVLGRAATHAGGVVGGNAADLAGGNRCRIGTDLSPEGGKSSIDFAADDPRPETYAECIGSQLKAGKAFSDQDQDTVGNRLPGQAGACGTEGKVNILLTSHSQHVRHVGLIFHNNHDPWNQPVETGISTPGQPSQFISDDALCRETPAKCRNKRVHFPPAPLSYNTMDDNGFHKHTAAN